MNFFMLKEHSNDFHRKKILDKIHYEVNFMWNEVNIQKFLAVRKFILNSFEKIHFTFWEWYTCRYRCKCLCCRMGWVWWWGLMMSQRSPWVGWPCWVTLSRSLCQMGRGDPQTCPSSPTSQSPASKSLQTCRLLKYFI